MMEAALSSLRGIEAWHMDLAEQATTADQEHDWAGLK